MESWFRPHRRPHFLNPERTRLASDLAQAHNTGGKQFSSADISSAGLRSACRGQFRAVSLVSDDSFDEEFAGQPALSCNA